jgi:RimK family alpha-L-glutamate ligase
MRIALLSNGEGWHVRDLLRGAVACGVTAFPLDFRTVQASISTRPAPLDFDGVIVRTMPPGSLEQVVFRMDWLHALEVRGVPILNPTKSLEVCIDKYLALVRLSQAGLPVPETIVCQRAEEAQAAFESLGSDVVVKPIFGSEGRGMIRLSDVDIAWRVFQAIERTQSILYVQRFIPHPGYDIRAFVLRGRVIAAMKRHSTNGDWRTNVSRGATSEAITLPEELQSLALQAAKAVGTIAAGVDLLPGPEGWSVIEVNAVPGWKALSPTCGIDIAREMLLAIQEMK